MIIKLIELLLSIAILMNIFTHNIQMAMFLTLLLILRKVSTRNES